MVTSLREGLKEERETAWRGVAPVNLSDDRDGLIDDAIGIILTIYVFLYLVASLSLEQQTKEEGRRVCAKVTISFFN